MKNWERHDYINVAHNWKRANEYVDSRDKQIEKNVENGSLLVFKLFGLFGRFWIVAGPVALFMGLIGALLFGIGGFLLFSGVMLGTCALCYRGDGKWI